MRVVMFLVYLSVLLLGGNSNAFAGTYSNNAQSEQVQHFNQDHSTFDYLNLDSEKEYLVYDDVEDEEENNFCAGKYKLQARSYAIPFFQSLLTCYCNPFKASPSYCGQSSHKYILQRTLRI